MRACTGRCDRVPRGAGSRVPGPGQLNGKKHHKHQDPTSEIMDLWCFTSEHATLEIILSELRLSDFFSQDGVDGAATRILETDLEIQVSKRPRIRKCPSVQESGSFQVSKHPGIRKCPSAQQESKCPGVHLCQSVQMSVQTCGRDHWVSVPASDTWNLI